MLPGVTGVEVVEAAVVEAAGTRALHVTLVRAHK